MEPEQPQKQRSPSQGQTGGHRHRGRQPLAGTHLQPAGPRPLPPGLRRKGDPGLYHERRTALLWPGNGGLPAGEEHCGGGRALAAGQLRQPGLAALPPERVVREPRIRGQGGGTAARRPVSSTGAAPSGGPGRESMDPYELWPGRPTQSGGALQ